MILTGNHSYKSLLFYKIPPPKTISLRNHAVFAPSVRIAASGIDLRELFAEPENPANDTSCNNN